MFSWRVILFPFAVVYGTIVLVRNFLYDKQLFKSSRFSIPVICIGNLSMGGTGKTPHTEYLIRLLKDNYKIATLSRGFGRKDRQFRIADEQATALNLGDEPLQFYHKFKNEIVVAAEANRVHGVMDICREKPETNLILLDDAFQHRKIFCGFNILLTTFNEPFYRDFILPVGNLREFRNGMKRADAIIVTKCPNLNEDQKAEIKNAIQPKPHQSVFFSRIGYGQLKSLTGKDVLDQQSGKKFVLVTGIANANQLKEHLVRNNTLLHHFEFNDHHSFTESELNEIHELFDKFVDEKPVLITTEKDAMRLMSEPLSLKISAYPWFYQEIEVELDNKEEFNKLILDYVEKNS